MRNVVRVRGERCDLPVSRGIHAGHSTSAVHRKTPGQLARRTGRAKTYYVREAILEHLEEIEDLYLAEGALERIRSGEERTIPLKQVRKRHGLKP
jgi:Predicted DNA-binding protein with an HTH domain